MFVMSFLHVVYCCSEELNWSFVFVGVDIINFLSECLN